MTEPALAATPTAKRVEGKVAIVTGAGSSAEGIGNGRGAAIMLARHGAKVAVVDFNENSAQETADMIAAEGGEALVIQSDVSDVRCCQDIVERTVKQWGRLDILVNNGVRAECGEMPLSSISMNGIAA